jgi:hypothetical protein
MTTLISTSYSDAYRDATRPHGIFEEFACQRLAVSRWQYERVAALAARYEPDSPEGVRFLNMAHRWETSYNRTMRELRQPRPSAPSPTPIATRRSPMSKRFNALRNETVFRPRPRQTPPPKLLQTHNPNWINEVRNEMPIPTPIPPATHFARAVPGKSTSAAAATKLPPSSTPPETEVSKAVEVASA